MADPPGSFNLQARHQCRFHNPVNKLLTRGCFGFCEVDSSKPRPAYPWKTQDKHIEQTKNIERLEKAAAEVEESLCIARAPCPDRKARQKLQKTLTSLTAELDRLRHLIATRVSERDAVAFIHHTQSRHWSLHSSLSSGAGS